MHFNAISKRRIVKHHLTTHLFYSQAYIFHALHICNEFFCKNFGKWKRLKKPSLINFNEKKISNVNISVQTQGHRNQFILQENKLL